MSLSPFTLKKYMVAKPVRVCARVRAYVRAYVRVCVCLCVCLCGMYFIARHSQAAISYQRHIHINIMQISCQVFVCYCFEDDPKPCDM